MFPDLDTLVLFGVPLLPLIFGIVEFIKSQGVTGSVLTYISAGLGVAGGVLYQLSTAGLPADFYGWLYAVTFGLVVGLATSGVYKFLNVRLPARN